MILGAAAQTCREPLSDNDSVIHDAAQPLHHLHRRRSGDRGDLVAYGQRGQVVMNHVSRAMFLPNNLERDTAVRVAAAAGPGGRFAQRRSDPSRAFGGQPVTEGVY